ncbi:hypothetical protein B0H11DRAFT_2354448 [Mycena galericulata]|nr:hypothetical protein B0H11DRAFT_2354448 [Mycena galericulata]
MVAQIWADRRRGDDPTAVTTMECTGDLRDGDARGSHRRRISGTGSKQGWMTKPTNSLTTPNRATTPPHRHLRRPPPPPHPADTIPAYSIPVAQQIIWEIAEVNFRFELLALDKRASGQTRPQQVRMCFSGGMLVEVPLELSKKGLAAPALEERHRYQLRLATLMLDWRAQCRRPSSIIPSILEKTEWSRQEMHDLEWAVTRYYTLCFFEIFGRAAVLPMRIEGEIVEMPDVSSAH